MGIWIQIQPGSDKAVYTQIMDQIAEAIARGQLNIGDKLPAVRKLAAELVINPNTVARAYSRLEQSGVVVTKKGSGTFVSDPKLRHRDAADMALLAERMDTIIARAITLGLSPGEISSVFATRMQPFKSASQEKEESS
jgi:GntR family transcriptional regulator